MSNIVNICVFPEKYLIFDKNPEFASKQTTNSLQFPHFSPTLVAKYPPLQSMYLPEEHTNLGWGQALLDQLEDDGLVGRLLQSDIIAKFKIYGYLNSYKAVNRIGKYF